MRRTLLAFLALVLAQPALAWGALGHETIALIARAHLAPVARQKVDALLATDPDTLTAPDMAARAAWADAWRDHGHRETALWHYVDIELTGEPDAIAAKIDDACYNFPPQTSLASQGPTRDCVLSKIDQFWKELALESFPAAERVLALKYLLHFVGDLHQPLHAADKHDRGGNCEALDIAGPHPNLHAYWDTTVVAALGRDPVALAAELDARITPEQIRGWSAGDARDWAAESYGVARDVAFALAAPGGCAAGAPSLELPDGYEQRAEAAASLQLQRAGIRLAALLNLALARTRAEVGPYPSVNGFPLPVPE